MSYPVEKITNKGGYLRCPPPLECRAQEVAQNLQEEASTEKHPKGMNLNSLSGGGEVRWGNELGK